MTSANIGRWLPFFEQHFPTQDDARAFVEPLEALCSGDLRHPAKIMMHQTHRLVSLSDDLPEIRKGNEGLRLLFLLICAENIAKIANGFDGEGQSRRYVQNFFTWFLSAEQQQSLCNALSHYDRRPMTLREAVNALYEVRCDVVHEGKYWGFHFHDGKTPIVNDAPDVIVSLTLSEFRNLIVEGCICAINRFPQVS